MAVGRNSLVAFGGVNWAVVLVAAIIYTTMLVLFRPPPQQAVTHLRAGQHPTEPLGTPHPPVAAQENDRRAFVLAMALHAWRGYMKHASGHDELSPVTNSSKDNWGRTLPTAYDALSFFLVANREVEFSEAARLVARTDFTKASRGFGASVFETTIRHLGACLSVYTVSKSPKAAVFLAKAVEIANALLPAFDTPTGIALHQVALGTTSATNQNWCNGKSILAEAGTLQMEFRLLSRLTGNNTYAEKAERFTNHLHESRRRGWPTNADLYERDAPQMKHRGLWPTFIDPNSGKWSGAASLASLSDSFYEYLLKQWILFGRDYDDPILNLYEDAVDAILTKLLHYSPTTHMAYVGHEGYGFEPTLDHLTCFVPGMLVLGVMTGAHQARPNRAVYTWTEDDVAKAAVDLAATCYRLYFESPTGIGPEVVSFNSDGTYSVTNPKYILRPELIESLFYLFRFTGDSKYRDWGWHIATAIEHHCKTPAGYTAVKSVLEVPVRPTNSMESFFFAETLKYLYLLFSEPHVVPLDHYVFNTEGHPLRIVDSRKFPKSRGAKVE